jgi:hypothetical protein
MLDMQRFSDEKAPINLKYNKWTIYYSTASKKYSICDSLTYRLNEVYFKTKEIAEEAIEKFKDRMEDIRLAEMELRKKK